MASVSCNTKLDFSLVCVYINIFWKAEHIFFL